MSQRRAGIIVICMSMSCAPGCFSPTVKYPNLLNPGTIAQQRYEAAIWDPYPDSSIGPAVIGARPREYMQQIPQAQRAQIWSDLSWGPRPSP
jgi:hypothetical protein